MNDNKKPMLESYANLCVSTSRPKRRHQYARTKQAVENVISGFC